MLNEPLARPHGWTDRRRKDDIQNPSQPAGNTSDSNRLPGPTELFGPDLTAGHQSKASNKPDNNSTYSVSDASYLPTPHQQYSSGHAMASRPSTANSYQSCLPPPIQRHSSDQPTRQPPHGITDPRIHGKLQYRTAQDRMLISISLQCTSRTAALHHALSVNSAITIPTESKRVS